MRSIAFADFLIGLGILFVLEGLMFAASPDLDRRAMKSALATPDHILRARRHRIGGGRPDPDLAGAPLTTWTQIRARWSCRLREQRLFFAEMLRSNLARRPASGAV